MPLAALLPNELADRLGLREAWRGRQLFKWVQKPVRTFRDMTDLPAALREELSRRAVLRTLRPGERLRDPDGSVKLRLETSGSVSIESVLLQDRQDRRTACLSTQAGCAMGCRFCRTGAMGLARSLEAHEIVEQFLILKEELGPIDTVVFMGMGEPLANLAAVRRVVEVLQHPLGSAMSPRRLTLSTCGLVAGLRALTAEGPPVRLAFSLITADPRVRGELMPVQRGNPLEEVKQALLAWQARTGQRVTLEVVLIDGVTDREEDLQALLDFIPPLRVLVNLIRWNPVDGLPYRESPLQRVNRFEAALESAGVPAVLRVSRGRRVAAACGQLALRPGNQTL